MFIFTISHVFFCLVTVYWAYWVSFFYQNNTYHIHNPIYTEKIFCKQKIFKLDRADTINNMEDVQEYEKN